jgi:hypothetical protein
VADQDEKINRFHKKTIETMNREKLRSLQEKKLKNKSPSRGLDGKVMRMVNPLRRINQVCIVVRDLQKTMERYWEDLGIGPWKIYQFEGPLLREMTIKGKPAKYKMSLALCQMDNIFLELIQPLSGETIYKEFLEEKGEGLHHLGFFVDDLDQALRNFEMSGIGTIQTGRFQRGGFAYLDTQEKLGTIFELIERSKPPHPPIRIWPEEDK